MKRTLKQWFALVLAVVCVFSVMITPAAAIEMRASREPTALAPRNWYNTPHQFTCTYYTFSSYLIDSTHYTTVEAESVKPFILELYTEDDVMFESVRARQNSGQTADAMYFAGVTGIEGLDCYYFVIRNAGDTPITDDDYSVVTVNWWDYVR